MKHATRDEYRHMLCYGVLTAAAHAALTTLWQRFARQTPPLATPRTPTTYSTPRLARSRRAGRLAAEDRLPYLRRFKCKKALTGEERVAERLVYSRFFDTTAAERSSNGVDGLLNALDDKRLELTFLKGELARFVASGAWEFGTCHTWVLRLFLMPKPGVKQWRCIIDLRVLNSFCVRKRLNMETLLEVRHLTKKGDYMFSFDLQDGFYGPCIAEADRDYFTVDPTRSKRYLMRTRWRGARILPYVDDFLLFSASMEQALHVRQRLASLLDALGLQRNPTKGFWEPRQFVWHMGVDIDSASGMFYTPAGKLSRLSRQATQRIGRAT
eukprot:jgi/Tetstr1/432268/TSEL_002302.t1